MTGVDAWPHDRSRESIIDALSVVVVNYLSSKDLFLLTATATAMTPSVPKSQI